MNVKDQHDSNNVITFSIDRASGSWGSDTPPIHRQCHRHENGFWLVDLAPSQILNLSIEIGHDLIVQPNANYVKGMPHLFIVDDYY